MGACLGKMGIKVPMPIEDTKDEDCNPRKRFKLVPINKVGDYCEGEDGNTTLPVKFNQVTSLAILDSGAGVAIATKQIWVSWSQPALRKTRMEIQLVDCYVERPMGLLEKVVVLSLNIEYKHTFSRL